LIQLAKFVFRVKSARGWKSLLLLAAVAVPRHLKT
jgi:hypothetical protein